MAFEEWWKALIARDYTRNNIELQDIAREAWYAAQAQLKPSWNEAPSFANYLAQDPDGIWYWFEEKPKLGDKCWLDRGFDRRECRIPNWQQSLEERL
jgi:hypothetical protein